VIDASKEPGKWADHHLLPVYHYGVGLDDCGRADAAALAAAARLDVVTFRETGQMVFLPDASANAQYYASSNAGFLAKQGIGVGVTQIWIDSGSRVVFVTVSANLSSLLPGFLEHRGSYSVTGYAQARMQGNP